ncbi:hypothetical protein AAT19DRAFT_13472 [Rhodotorula toruloides]|uniref:Uncharacterized protein n=1 Tax=Rhodotorula toruloides TaxID=5286 RepID=A0A2T0AEL7_RHOTO|nr:hypothetical protein AAT19DRAFT_13472 [Rhodotorula toruloides]
MRIFLYSFALCAVAALVFGLAQTLEVAGESVATSLARQGPRRLARSDAASLAASSDQVHSSPPTPALPAS